jgi:hypothetical protein
MGENKQKTLLEGMEDGHEKIDAVIKTTNATFKWVDTVQRFIQRHGFKKLFIDLIFVGGVVLVGLAFFQPSILSNRLDQYREQKHAEKMAERMNNTPLIQAELDKFKIKTEASWVSIWELHNSTNNLDGMPFLFASLTYESMNPALTPIAEQFDNVRLSLYPLVSYLRENEMWYGSVEDIKEVDNTAYYRAKALGIKYLGFRLMENEGAPNAVMSFAYVEGADVADERLLVQEWIMSSYKVNSLLSVGGSEKKKK